MTSDLNDIGVSAISECDQGDLMEQEYAIPLILFSGYGCLFDTCIEHKKLVLLESKLLPMSRKPGFFWTCVGHDNCG